MIWLEGKGSTLCAIEVSGLVHCSWQSGAALAVGEKRSVARAFGAIGSAWHGIRVWRTRVAKVVALSLEAKVRHGGGGVWAKVGKKLEVEISDF